NIFFYDLGRRLGYEKFNKVGNTLGLGVKTGIEIPEATGALSSPQVRADIIAKQLENGLSQAQTSEEWQGGNVAQASIGQMDTNITTIQLATFGAALANNGVRYGTHFVGSLNSFDNDPEKTVNIKPKVLGQIEDKNDAFQTVENGMVRASFYGTVRDSLKDYPYTIATKTGTAQVTLDSYNATMIAYGPTQAPEIAVGVIVENCSNSYRLANSVKSIFDAYYFNKSESMLPQSYNSLLP
ncbi:MAG: penicillin-binding transpeptidase domain-containing protein, partial [Oscillospiraceae bacterium]